jgi:hypothetical protein
VVNFGFGIYVGSLVLITWLGRVRWYKMTGGLVPMMKWDPPPRELLWWFLTALMPMSAWLLAVHLWLAPILWPNRLPELLVITLIDLAPFFVLDFLGLRYKRFRNERMWQLWRRSSRLERAFMVLLNAWPLPLLLLLPSPTGWLWWLCGNHVWLVGPTFVLIFLSGLMILGLATSTRRR